MNAKQKLLVRAAVVVALLMLLYSPFAYYGQNGAKVAAGFGFIFTGPSSWTGYNKPSVDVAQLLVQIVIVSVAGAVAWFTLKD